MSESDKWNLEQWDGGVRITNLGVTRNTEPFDIEDGAVWVACPIEFKAAETSVAALDYEVLPPASEPEKPSKRIDEMDLDDFRRGCAVVMKPKWMEY